MSDTYKRLKARKKLIELGVNPTSINVDRMMRRQEHDKILRKYGGKIDWKKVKWRK